MQTHPAYNRTSREELNRLASEAGKLGITGVESVESFVAAADQIGVALGDDLGEGAMVTIGKMAQVYAKSTEELAAADIGGQMLRIGSAVNSLGAASAANEAHMTDFLARMGGMAVQAGMTAQQVLGYASALDQSGVSTERAATALQNMMARMYQKPAEFAAVAGSKLPSPGMPSSCTRRHLCPLGVGLVEAGSVSKSVFEVGTPQVGAFEVGTVKVGTREVSTRKVGARKVAAPKVGHTEIHSVQVGAAQVGRERGCGWIRTVDAA